MTGNDTKEVIYEKVSNTERLAGIVITILKVIGILIIVSIIATVISIIAFTGIRQNVSVEHDLKSVEITESVGEQKLCLFDIRCRFTRFPYLKILVMYECLRPFA